MNLFYYLEILQLDQSKLNALRNRDYIQLEKKMNSKSFLNSKIEKNEIVEFIKILKNNTREVANLLDSSFFVLKKIIQSPNELNLYEPKQTIQKFETDRLKQFVHSQFSSQLNSYTELCIKENNLRALFSFMHYWTVIPIFCQEKIKQYLQEKLIECNNQLESHLPFYPELSETMSNPFYYRCLNLIKTQETDRCIIKFQKFISEKTSSSVCNEEYYKMAFSLSHYEITIPEVKSNLEILKQKSEEIGLFESLRSEKKPKGGVSKKIEYSQQTTKKSRSYSGATAGISVFGIGAAITIIRALFGLFGPDNSATNNNNYYEENRELYQPADYEIKKIQKELIYIHTTKEILNTQKEPFNRTRMKFISMYDKYPFPGAHTVIKNKTDKNVVFFFNTDFGGFKYKIVQPNSEVTLTLRYKFFFVFRGNDQYYTVYEDVNGERKVGILFDEFDKSDMELLKTMYTNEIQKQRKQSEIIISENGVEINEKS